MRIVKQHVLAVLVDVQERLFPHMWERESLERNLLILLQGLRILDIPLLVTQQYTRGLGPTIPPIREILGWDRSQVSAEARLGDTAAVPADAAASASNDRPYIEKIAFSCWDEPLFRQAFTVLDRPCVLLAGIESHVCMLQTAVDLKQAGFTPVVLEDCTSSRRANDKRIAFDRLRSEGVAASTYESILFELTREAGSETFKAISRLVK